MYFGTAKAFRPLRASIVVALLFFLAGGRTDLPDDRRHQFLERYASLEGETVREMNLWSPMRMRMSCRDFVIEEFYVSVEEA